MSNFAVIENGVVTNVIIADTQEIAEAVTGLTSIEVEQVPGAPGIGWLYDGSEFSAPPVEETPSE
jgi:hypothetical protein